MLKPKYTSQILKPSIDYQFLQYYMLPQPQQFQYVYRPSDDTFLFLSVIYQQIIISSQHPSIISHHPTICQVGSGSGILSAHLHQWLKNINRVPLIHVSTDINPDACMLSAKYYKHYNLNIASIHTSLLNNLKTNKPLHPKTPYSFQPQIIICNPPYIPTDPQQTISQKQYLKNRLKSFTSQRQFSNNMISYSWMGGVDGLQTTRKLIKSIMWQCVLYIIVMGSEYVQQLSKQINQIVNKGFICQFNVLQRMKKYNEQLFVVRIIFTSTQMQN